MRPSSGAEHTGSVTDSIELDDNDLEKLVSSWLTIPDAAERLGVTPSKVKQYVKERQLLSVRRAERGGPFVPEAFVRDGQILNGLSGTLTLLHDAGFGVDEAVRWLFTDNETLSGTPVDALAQRRHKAVHRTAQVAGF